MGVLPACLLGVGIMRMYGSPMSMPVMNLVAALLGLVLIAWLSSAMVAGIQKRPEIVALGGLAIFAATQLDPGLDGVHRWVTLGPVRLHVGALFAPIVLLAVVALWVRQKTSLAVLTLALGLVFFVAQPDAGQTTAWAAAVVALAALPGKRLAMRFVLVVLAALGTIAAWMRPDPLAGVPMVEGIVGEAWRMHSALGAGAMVALALLPLSALFAARRARTNYLAVRYGLVLATYFVGSLVVVAIGEFPTPVLGFGASPMLGAVLGLGLLGRVEQGLRAEPAV